MGGTEIALAKDVPRIITDSYSYLKVLIGFGTVIALASYVPRMQLLPKSKNGGRTANFLLAFSIVIFRGAGGIRKRGFSGRGMGCLRASCPPR